MGTRRCFGCGKKYDNSFRFCPHCGRKKGASIEEIRQKKSDEIKSIVEENVKIHRDMMSKTDEILEVLKEKDKTTYAMQKKLTEKIIRRFPDIERKMREDPDLEFDAFIINVPYWQEEDVYLHHCMLQEFAKRSSNIANFSLGVQELAANLCLVNIPIWTNDPPGEVALKKQYEILKEVIPWEQRRFIYVAEPWHFVTRVHDFDGRWINWKFVFKISPEEFKGFVDQFKEIPLSIQIFADLKHAKHFSTVGTALDGESFLGIVEDNEITDFNRKFRFLESSFPKDYKPTLEMIEITWDLLKELGFLSFALQKVLSSEPHIFSRDASKTIMEVSKDELAAFTGRNILRKRQDKDAILDTITDNLIERALAKQKEIMSGNVKPISRDQRSEYRIFGDVA